MSSPFCIQKGTKVKRKKIKKRLIIKYKIDQFGSFSFEFYSICRYIVN